jgi:hypothetical protein
MIHVVLDSVMIDMMCQSEHAEKLVKIRSQKLCFYDFSRIMVATTV